MGNPKKIYGNLQQEDLDRDEEQEPVKSYTLSEYAETHPQVAESPWEAIGEINRAISILFQSTL